jgi:hypothetical protein
LVARGKDLLRFHSRVEKCPKLLEARVERQEVGVLGNGAKQRITGSGHTAVDRSELVGS